MAVCEIVSFHHSQVKFMTPQELHSHNMQSLIRDSNKICDLSEFITYSVIECKANKRISIIFPY